MKRIVTLISAVAVFVAMSLVVCLAPTGFVLWAPGPAVNLLSTSDLPSPIEISGRQTYASTGQILSTSLTQTPSSATVTLPAVITNYFRAHHEVVPRDAVYSPGQTSDESDSATLELVQSSRNAAVIQGMQESGMDLKLMAMVETVRQSGPAYQKLYPGDFIVDIDGTVIENRSDVVNYVQRKAVNQDVLMTVLRANEIVKVQVNLAGSTTDGRIPTTGATYVNGYLNAPPYRIDLDPALGTPSQGLAFALATYVILTEQDELAGQIVAATGILAESSPGEVGFVSGVNELAASAANAHASVFIIPRANCAELQGAYEGMRVVPVSTLDQAVDILGELGQDDAVLPHC